MPWPDNLFAQAEAGYNNGNYFGAPSYVVNQINSMKDSGVIPTGSSSSSASLVDSSVEPGTLEWLKSMAKEHPEYAEKLLDYYIDQSNVNSAREYDSYIRSHSYQMMVDDLKAAGLNPWLALNSLGASGGANIQANNSTSSAQSTLNSKNLGNNKILAMLLAALLGTTGKLIAAAL